MCYSFLIFNPNFYFLKCYIIIADFSFMNFNFCVMFLCIWESIQVIKAFLIDFERHLLRPDWFLKAFWLHFLWTISLFDKPKIWFPSLSSLNRWLKGNIPRNTIFNILWEVNTQQDGREDVSIMCGCEQRTHILLSIPKDAGFTGVLHLLMIMLWYDSWQLTFCARRISLRSCGHLFNGLEAHVCSVCWCFHAVAVGTRPLHLRLHLQ